MTGVLPLLKPPGMSSQQAVSQVRRLAGIRRCGHAGTLDPEAAGVLPVLLGRATKLSDYLTHAPKEYIAELCVGIGTDTLDSEGRVIARSVSRFSAEQLSAVLPRFTGLIEQAPPRYSAVKVGGRPLYAYARAGRTAEAPSRMVSIEELELLRGGGDRFLLRVACGQGTYVRTLLSDIAAALGTVGYTSFLLRTKAGHVDIADTCTLEDLSAETLPDLLRPPGEAVQLKRLVLPARLLRIVESGAPIDMLRVPEAAAAPDTDYAVWCGGTFFGIGRLEERGLVLQARLTV